MPDPTKEEQAHAAARAAASAAPAPSQPPARAATPAAPAAPAPAPAPAKAAAPADATSAIVETLKNLEQRSRPAGYASATPGLDEAGEKGPVYRVGGQLVNAHGREVREDGSLVHPEQQQVDQYGRLT